MMGTVNVDLSFLIKLAIPVISALGTGAIKKSGEKWSATIPSWLKPLLSSLLGAIVGVLAGQAESVDIDGQTGFLIGSLGPAAREIYRAVVPEKTA